MNSSNNAEHISLSVRPTIILSKELQAQILYFHSVVGDIEWSGPLYFTTVQGSVEDLNNFVIKAELMLPKDVGTPGFTSYEMGPEVMDFYDAYPQVMTMKMGHIHTHHSMTTYFSGTDMQELQDNAPNHNYYVSLIVNHKGKYDARIAISAILDRSVTYKGTAGDRITEQIGNKTVLMTATFNIVFEQDEFMVNSIDSLIKAAKERQEFVSKVAPKTVPTTTRYYKPVNKSNGYKPYAPELPLYVHDDKDELDTINDVVKVEAFLAKLISLNTHTTTSLKDVLLTLNKRFSGNLLDAYVTKVMDKFMEYYESEFAKDNPEEAIEIYSFIIDCSLLLEDYTTNNILAEALVIAFDDLATDTVI